MNDSSISPNINPNSKLGKTRIAKSKHAVHIAQLVALRGEGVALTAVEEALLVHWSELSKEQAAIYYEPNLQFIAGKRKITREAS